MISRVQALCEVTSFTAARVKKARPVLQWTWLGPGTPWCCPGPGRGPSRRSARRMCSQTNRTAESGCLSKARERINISLKCHRVPKRTPPSARLQEITWKELHKNLLQELNQQASGLLFVFSQLEPLHHVLHLCIHLEQNQGRQLQRMQRKICIL